MKSIQQIPFEKEIISTSLSVLEHKKQGWKYIFDPVDMNDFKLDTYEHIEFQCKLMAPDEQQLFYDRFTKIRYSLPWLNHIPVSLREPNAPLKCITTNVSQSEQCKKCGRDGTRFNIYRCKNCEKYFHIECETRQYMIQMKNRLDPFFNVFESKLDDMTNNIGVYDDDYGYLITDQYEKFLCYCSDCFAEVCSICGCSYKVHKCSTCGIYYHRECGRITDITNPVCYFCEQDGGIGSVEKLVSIKAISRRQIFHLQLEQLTDIINNDTISEEEFYSHRQKRSPLNLSVSHFVWFLVKIKYHSYWRVMWVSHQRLLIIAKSLMIVNKLSNAYDIYSFMQQNYGLDRSVDCEEVFALSQEDIDDQFDEDIMNYENQEVSTTQLQSQDNKRNLVKLAEFAPMSNNELANLDDIQFLLLYLKDDEKQKIFQMVPEIPQHQILTIEKYFAELLDSAVPYHFLIPDQILSRYQHSYLVRWTSQPYSESTFESAYFLLPFSAGKRAIIRFLLISTGLNRQSIFSMIKMSKKPWIDYTLSSSNINGIYLPFKEIPPYLAIDNKKLFDFQLTGINWLLFNHSIGRGVLLCDQMGLGKTIQVAGFLGGLYENGCIGPHLIIVPNSTIHNWQREIKKWLPWMSTTLIEVRDKFGLEFIIRTAGKVLYQSSFCQETLSQSQLNSNPKMYQQSFLDLIASLDEFQFVSSTPSQVRKINGYTVFDIFIMSYETALCLSKRRVQQFQGQFKASFWDSFLNIYGPFSTFICDEGHRVKSDSTQLFQLLMKVKSSQKILLTGTPIQNTFDEIVTLLSFVDNFFTSNTQKQLLINSQIASNLSIPQLQRNQSLCFITQILKPFVLIRSQQDVFINQIRKSEIYVPVDMTKIQKLLYAKLIYEHKSNFQSSDIDKSKLRLSNLAMSLRHLTNHPFLCQQHFCSLLSSKSFDQTLLLSSKLSVLNRLIQQLIRQKRKILIYSQFVMVLDVIEYLLKHNKVTYLRMDGKTDQSLRLRLIDRFNDPDSLISVFLMTTQTGGIGINLQAASDIIIYDSSWNPQNDIQAIYRVARIGQDKVVRVYRLFCRDSIDQKIVERAKQKTAMNYIFTRPLSQGELKDDNIEEILLFGVQNLLMDYKKDILDQKISIDLLDLNSIGFDQLVLELESESEIQYTDEQLFQLISNDPNELTTDFQSNSFRDSNGQLNKDEFFSNFKVAQFNQAIQPGNVLKQSIHSNYEQKQFDNQIKATSANGWNSVFQQVFGDQLSRPGLQLKNEQISTIQKQKKTKQQSTSGSEVSDVCSESYVPQNDESDDYSDLSDDISPIEPNKFRKMTDDRSTLLTQRQYYVIRFTQPNQFLKQLQLNCFMFPDTQTSIKVDKVDIILMNQLEPLISDLFEKMNINQSLFKCLILLVLESFNSKPAPLVYFQNYNLSDVIKEKRKQLLTTGLEGINILKLYGEFASIGNIDKFIQQKLSNHSYFNLLVGKSLKDQEFQNIYIQQQHEKLYYIYDSVFTFDQNQVTIDFDKINAQNCKTIAFDEYKKQNESQLNFFGMRFDDVKQCNLVSLIPPNMQSDVLRASTFLLADQLKLYYEQFLKIYTELQDAEMALLIINARRSFTAIYLSFLMHSKNYDQYDILAQQVLDNSVSFTNSIISVGEQRITFDTQLSQKLSIQVLTVIVLKRFALLNQLLPFKDWYHADTKLNVELFFADNKELLDRLFITLSILLGRIGVLDQMQLNDVIQHNFMNQKMFEVDVLFVKQQTSQVKQLKAQTYNNIKYQMYQQSQYDLTSSKEMKGNQYQIYLSSIIKHNLLFRERKLLAWATPQAYLDFCTFFGPLGFPTNMKLFKMFQTKMKNIPIYQNLLKHISSIHEISYINGFFRTQQQVFNNTCICQQIFFLDSVSRYIIDLAYGDTDDEYLLIEALIQVGGEIQANCVSLGISLNETSTLSSQCFPMFGLNKLLSSEQKRIIIPQKFAKFISKLLSKQQPGIGLNEKQLLFIKTILNNAVSSLLCGIIVIGLYKYGLHNFLVYSLFDQTLGLNQLLSIVESNLKQLWHSSRTNNLTLCEDNFDFIICQDQSAQQKIAHIAVILYIIIIQADIVDLPVFRSSDIFCNDISLQCVQPLVEIEKQHSLILTKYGFNCQ